MSNELKYMPHVTINHMTYSLIEMHIAIDFGGRQVDCVFQYKDEEGEYYTITKTYYPKLKKWCDEEWPINNKMTQAAHYLFEIFDDKLKENKDD